MTTGVGVRVYVGADADDGLDALLAGRVVIVAGQCLGVWADEEQGERTVLWPKGTRVITEKPLTIVVNGVTLTVGDRVSLVNRPTFTGARNLAAWLLLSWAP